MRITIKTTQCPMCSVRASQVLDQIERKMRHPLAPTFQADFLDNVESANADRYVYGSISMSYLQNHHFRFVCLPRFGDVRLGN